MRYTGVVRTATFFLLVGVIAAQEKPNFSGTWVPFEGVNPKVELTLKQDAGVLSGRAGDDAAHQFEYRLDGAESKQAAGDVTSQVRWDADKLVVMNTFRSKGTVVAVQKQVWSLTSDGLLVIDTSRERDGKPVQTSKATYKRLRK
jgi:hypothetical protein